MLRTSVGGFTTLVWDYELGAYTLPAVGIVCFLAGTLVETADGPKPIEQIAVGDRIWSGDGERYEIERAQVVALPGGVVTNLVCIELNAEQIWCTGEHRFWVCDKGWVRAKRLEPGFLLVSEDWKPVPVTGVSFVTTNVPTRVYNLTVTGGHSFFVGKTRVLVHNMMSGGQK